MDQRSNTPLVHTCGNCGRYTAVVAGWAHDFEMDGFTPSARVHNCVSGEVIGHGVTS